MLLKITDIMSTPTKFPKFFHFSKSMLLDRSFLSGLFKAIFSVYWGKCDEGFRITMEKWKRGRAPFLVWLIFCNLKMHNSSQSMNNDKLSLTQIKTFHFSPTINHTYAYIFLGREIGIILTFYLLPFKKLPFSTIPYFLPIFPLQGKTEKLAKQEAN